MSVSAGMLGGKGMRGGSGYAKLGFTNIGQEGMNHEGFVEPMMKGMPDFKSGMTTGVSTTQGGGARRRRRRGTKRRCTTKRSGSKRRGSKRRGTTKRRKTHKRKY